MLFHGAMGFGNDQRWAVVNRLLTMSVKTCQAFILPVLLALHELPTVFDTAVLDTAVLPLTSDSMSSEGVYVLFDTVETFIWIGKAAQGLCAEGLLGVQSYGEA